MGSVGRSLTELKDVDLEAFDGVVVARQAEVFANRFLLVSSSDISAVTNVPGFDGAGCLTHVVHLTHCALEGLNEIVGHAADFGACSECLLCPGTANATSPIKQSTNLAAAVVAFPG